MARPDTKALAQFPVNWPLYRQHQRRWEIDQILKQHDQGYFTRSAGLVDEMLTDDRIAGCADQRISALLSKPFTFKPGGKTKAHEKIRELLGGDGEDVKGMWREMAGTAALRETMIWGLFLGVGVAEMVWTKDNGAPQGRKWLPRLVPYHPQWIRWDWYYNRFVLITPENGQIILPRPDEQPDGDGKWFVFCPWGVRGGWRRALVRSLADKYIQRKWNERDWARYCEKNGLAIIEAQVPSEGDANDKQRFFDSTTNLNAESVVYAPQGAEGKASYGVDLIEPKAQTWQAFQAWKQALDEDIAIRIVGQPESTNSEKGGVGNNGNKNQADVAANILGEDAEIGPMLRRQVFAWHVEYNFGRRDLTPFCEFQVDPPDDEKTTGEAQSAKATAVNQWLMAGADVDVNAEAEKSGMALVAVEDRDPNEPKEQADGANEDEAPTDAAKKDDKVSEPEPPLRQKLRSWPQDVAKRYTFQGLPIAIENPKGSTRTWMDADGKAGRTTMQHDYGFIEGYLGEDGEEIDCYVGPDANAASVHIVHQLLAPDFKKNDEMKVMLGFPDAAAAQRAYLAHRDDGQQAFGGMTSLPLDRFKAKLSRRAPDSTTRIRASARPADVVALSAPKVVAGSQRAALYIDRLVLAAKRQGAEDMRPFLDEILSAVREGKDWSDIKARCLAVQRKGGGGALAQTMHHARVMGRMMGRDAIRN